MNIIDNTDRVGRLIPKRIIISNQVDLLPIRSEETDDKLSQLISIKMPKMGIITHILKVQSDSGKPLVTLYYEGESGDSGILLRIRESVDLTKPRTVTDILDEGIHNLVMNRLLPKDNFDNKFLSLQVKSLYNL